MRLHTAAVTAGLAGGVLCINGWGSDGLSPRQTSSGDYSAMVYGDYARNPTTAPTQLPRPVSVPIRIAIIQAGDVSPPQSMVDQLHSHVDLFSDVEALPEIRDVPVSFARFRNGSVDSVAQPQIGRMLQATVD